MDILNEQILRAKELMGIINEGSTRATLSNSCMEKIVKEQTLPSHIKKGSKEHAEWVRSQQGDGSDEILESLLSVSQRLARFVEDVRKGGRYYGTGETEDLKDIQKDVVYQITQYLGTTEGRTNKSTYKKHR